MKSVYEKSRELLDLLVSKNTYEEIDDKDSFEEITKIVSRGVAVEESIPQGSILFLGINPSYDEEKKAASGTYKLEDVGSNTFFKKAFQISKDNRKPFGHHDLFPFRETNQKFVEGMFIQKGEVLITKIQYKPFIEKCLSYAEDVIIRSNPCMIVVANAFVTHLFFDFHYSETGKTLLGFLPGDKGGIWDEKLGVDFVNINGRLVPILFSGMLSGQRALDFGSEFRLKWHIGHVLRNLEKNEEFYG